MNEIFEKYFSALTNTSKSEVKTTSNQKQLINFFLTKNNISILKKRNIGFTTLVLSYILFLIESNSDKKEITIITLNNSQTNFIMNKFCNYISNNSNNYNYHDFNFSFSKNKIRIFDYRISVIVSSDLEKSLRGYIPDLLIIDEGSCLENKDCNFLLFLFKTILFRSGQIVCSLSTNSTENPLIKRHFESKSLPIICKREVILEKKGFKKNIFCEKPFFVDCREVFEK
jgi:hypothetical protein